MYTAAHVIAITAIALSLLTIVTALTRIRLSRSRKVAALPGQCEWCRQRVTQETA